jgi:hypothetical protein
LEGPSLKGEKRADLPVMQLTKLKKESVTCQHPRNISRGRPNVCAWRNSQTIQATGGFCLNWVKPGAGLPSSQLPEPRVFTVGRAGMPVLRRNCNDRSGSSTAQNDTSRWVRCSFESSRNRADAALTLWPSRPGEFHPEPLTEPDVRLSTYPARAIARRLSPSIEHRVPPVTG